MSSNSDSYKQAIDILMAGDFNARNIAVELAKNYPTIFVKLANGVTSKVEQWMIDAHEFMARGAKVEAIKLIRTHTGLGLKEAKDISDNVQNLMAPHYGQLSHYDGAARLSEAMLAMTNAIAKAKSR